MKRKMLLLSVVIAALFTAGAALAACTLRQQPEQKFEVTFKIDYEDGRNDEEKVKVVSGQTATPNNPDLDAGCTLSGWYTDQNFEEDKKYDFDKPVTGDLTLYARAALKEELVSDYGQLPASITVGYGDAAELPAPTETGYIFEGWYTDPEFTDRYVSAQITESASFYAKWGKEKYRVGFTIAENPELGYRTHMNMVEYLDSPAAAAAAGLSGEWTVGGIPDGWYPDEQCSSPVDLNTLEIKGSQTFYLKTRPDLQKLWGLTALPDCTYAITKEPVLLRNEEFDCRSRQVYRPRGKGTRDFRHSKGRRSRQELRHALSDGRKYRQGGERGFRGLRLYALRVAAFQGCKRRAGRRLHRQRGEQSRPAYRLRLRGV